MKKFWVLTLFLAVAMTAFVAIVPFKTSGQKNKFRHAADRVPGSYIVVLEESVVGDSLTGDAVQGEANFLTGTYGGGVDKLFSNAIRGFSARMTEAEAVALSSDDRVAYVEEDSVVSVSSTQTGAPWNLDRVDQRNLPLNTNFDYANSGAGAHIYIFDTGIRVTHSEFGGRASVALDVLNDGQNGLDCNGHGTHVAGIAAGATYGIAKSAFVHSVRVLPCTGGGQISDIIAAVDWLTANRINPAVANISITAPGDSPAMETAITNSIASGITYTIAAGNAGWLACDYTPARTPNAITVGATADTDFRPNYSNYGSCVDIFAPGHNIVSAGITDDTAIRALTGTSQAAPLVAGVAAVYRASNPSASPSTVTQTILGTATSGAITNLGTGSPDRLVYSWLGAGPQPSPSPTVTPSPSPSPSPAPTSGLIRIRKRTNRTSGGTSSTASFPYQATNLTPTSFSLLENQEFSDPGVPQSSQVISVTESSVPGWRLTSVECVETAGSTPNIPNTTVDLANKRANIIVEAGESVTCTFTSEEMAPTAATVSLSGRIMDSRGRGVRGLRVMLQNAATGGVSYATTNSFGFYSFSTVPVNVLYVVTAVESKKYQIPNSTRSLLINEDMTGIDFFVEDSN